MAAKKTTKAPVGDHYVLIEGGAKSELMPKEDALNSAEAIHKTDGLYTAVVDTKDEWIVKDFGTPPAMKVAGKVDPELHPATVEEAIEVTAAKKEPAQKPSAAIQSVKDAVDKALAKKKKGESPKPAPAAKKVAPAKLAKPAKAAAEKTDTGVDRIIELAQRKQGATTKELAAATGWENAGWNTIMASIAERRGLKLTIAKQQAEGSKRQINVFRMAA